MLYAPTVLINWGEKMQFQMWILVFARSSQRIRNQPVNLRIFNLVLKSIISRIFCTYINGYLKSTVLSKLRDNALKIIIVKTSTLSFAQTKKTDGTMMKLTYAPSGIGSGIHNRNPEEGESIDRSIDLLISRRRTHFSLFFVLVIHRAPLGLNLNVETTVYSKTG